MKLTYIKLSVTQILFILLLALSNNVFAQNKEIKVTGTIYDETGITLPSVTVTVKGQKGVGVLSDNDGKFMITVPEGSTLIFSFVGMKSQEVSSRKCQTGSLQNYLERRYQGFGRSSRYRVPDAEKT